MHGNPHLMGRMVDGQAAVSEVDSFAMRLNAILTSDMTSVSGEGSAPGAGRGGELFECARQPRSRVQKHPLGLLAVGHPSSPHTHPLSLPPPPLPPPQLVYAQVSQENIPLGPLATLMPLLQMAGVLNDTNIKNALKQVRECQEQLVVLDRTHGIKVRREERWGGGGDWRRGGRRE
jgi:hypothetical protein